MTLVMFHFGKQAFWLRYLMWKHHSAWLEDEKEEDASEAQS